MSRHSAVTSRASACRSKRRSISRPLLNPEILLNIVDLGLVYWIEMMPQPDGAARVDTKMVLGTQGCGSGASVAFDAKSKQMAVAEVSEANVDLARDPPLNPQMIAAEAREKPSIE